MAASAVVRDVLQRRAPWWVTALLPSGASELKERLLITTAQRRQLGMILFHTGDGAKRVSGNTALCVVSEQPSVAAQALLMHGRFYRIVDRNRGDVVTHVDTTDFLSCSGRELTAVPHEARLLAERTHQHGLESPFWLSEVEVAHICAYSSVQLRFNCGRLANGGAADLFRDTSVAVELTCGLPGVTRYVNWGTLCPSMVGKKGLCRSLAFFRCFAPLNVRTKQRFSFAIDVRLRVESLCSGCWCSIWGTADDYEKCGFRALDGALGVDVFDDLGNPAFLIHALCTTNPSEVYAACYPDDSICMSDGF